MISRAVWASLFVVVAVAGCPRPIEEEPDAGPDGTDQFTVCTDVAECLALPGATEQNVRCDGVCLFIWLAGGLVGLALGPTIQWVTGLF